MLMGPLTSMNIDVINNNSATPTRFRHLPATHYNVWIIPYNAFSSIVHRCPECVNITTPITRKIAVLQASAVAVWTIVSVRPGDACLCDGITKEGQSMVHESKITGQSKPVVKYPGSYVSSSAINTGCTQLIVKTMTTSNNSAVARCICFIVQMETLASRPLSNVTVKGAADEQVYVPKLQLQNHTLLPGEGITANS